MKCISVLVVICALLVWLLVKPYQPLDLGQIYSYPEPTGHTPLKAAALERLSPAVQSWYQKGKYETVFGLDIFYVDSRAVSSQSNASSSSNTLVIVHGFPSSSFDFRATLEILHSKFDRIILHDFPGFGFSQKPEQYSYSLFEQAEVLIQLWKQLQVSKCHILAHDMGDSVTTEVLARRDRGFLPALDLSGVTFTNGGMLIHLANLRISQQVLRVHSLAEYVPHLYNYMIFEKQIRGLNLDNPALLPDHEVKAMWELNTLNGGISRMPQLINYLNERYQFQPRWIDAIKRLDIPVSIVWGEADAVAPLEIGQTLYTKVFKKKAAFEVIPYGHFPMLESPETFAQVVVKTINLAAETFSSEKVLN